MGDYISLEEAMNLPVLPKEQRIQLDNVDEAFEEGWRQALENLAILPAADVAPVRHGRWIEQPLDFDLCGVAYYQCSECGKEQQTPSHYCQFCGARMEGWKWCVWQDEDNEGVYCTVHIHEDRVLNCPYKNLEERQRADYPCQDYRPMDGGQEE